jgi:hypothetical protein
VILSKPVHEESRMGVGPPPVIELAPAVRAFYTRTLTGLKNTGIPFLVGGAYALERYTGIERHTKDFDLFIRAADLQRTLPVLEDLGCRTEITFRHWLAKAYRGDHFIDVIFNSGNGLAPVDDEWFEHSVDETVFGIPVQLVAVEELIWQKAFIMERERFDGADVAHLIQARGDLIDWRRLLRRFDDAHGHVLLAHLILFGYIYPDERGTIPQEILADLLGRLDAAPEPGPSKICRGPLLSRAQYLADIGWWGYRDARLEPIGPLTAEQIAHWTAAIGRIA